MSDAVSFEMNSKRGGTRRVYFHLDLWAQYAIPAVDAEQQKPRVEPAKEWDIAIVEVRHAAEGMHKGGVGGVVLSQRLLLLLTRAGAQRLNNWSDLAN